MKTSCYSIATDGSNDQGLQKMNLVTVRLFDINQNKVVTKFYDMCSSTFSTAVGIFTAINTAMMKNSITCGNCVSLTVDTQLTFTCSKLTIETLKKDVKYVQS